MTNREEAKVEEYQSFGRCFLYCLSLVFFLFLVISGIAMVVVGVYLFARDLELSVIPMRKIGLSQEIALGLSIMTSLSEILAALLFLDLKEVEKAIKNESVYRIILPVLNEKTLVGARIFFVLMFLYDLGTNIWGSYLSNPNPITFSLETIFLTLSEYFLILGLAIVLAIVWFGQRTLSQMRQGGRQVSDLSSEV